MEEFNKYYGHPVLTQYLLQDRKDKIITEEQFQEYMSLDISFGASEDERDKVTLLSKIYGYKYGVKIKNQYIKDEEILEYMSKYRDTDTEGSPLFDSLDVIFSEYGLRMFSLKKNPLTQKKYLDMNSNQKKYLSSMLNHYGIQAIEVEIISLEDYLDMDDKQRADLCYLFNNYGFKALLKNLINLKLFLQASSFVRHNLNFLFNSYGLQSLEEKDVKIEDFLSLKPPSEIKNRKVNTTGWLSTSSDDSLLRFLNLHYGKYSGRSALPVGMTVQKYANDYFSFEILFSAFGLQLLKLIDFKTYVAASYWPRCELRIFSSETGLKFLKTVYSLDKFLKIDFKTERSKELLLSKIFNEFGMKIMLLGFITPDEIYSATPEFRSEILGLFTPFGLKIIENNLFSFKEFSALKPHARKDLLKLLTPHGVRALLKQDITLELLNSNIFSKCETDHLFTVYGLLFIEGKLLTPQEYANSYSMLLKISPNKSLGGTFIALALFNPLSFEVCKAKKMSIKDWISPKGALLLNQLHRVSEYDTEMVSLIKNNLISSQDIMSYFHDDKLRETLRLTLYKNGCYILKDWQTSKPFATDPVLLRKIASVDTIQAIKNKKLTLEEVVLNHSTEEKIAENNFSSSLFLTRPSLKVWNLAEGEEKIFDDHHFNCAISLNQLNNYLSDIRQMLNDLPEFCQNSIGKLFKVQAVHYDDKVILEKELRFYQDEIKKIPSSKNIIHILQSLVIKLNAFRKLIEPKAKGSESSRYYNALKAFFSIDVESTRNYWPEGVSDLVYILKNRSDFRDPNWGGRNEHTVEYLDIRELRLHKGN